MSRPTKTMDLDTAIRALIKKHPGWTTMDAAMFIYNRAQRYTAEWDEVSVYIGRLRNSVHPSRPKIISTR